MGRRKPVTAYADEDKQIAHEAAELEYDIESVWDFVNNNPHPFLPYREFAAEKDPHLQWVLANALCTAMPLKDRKRHPEIAKVFNAKGSLPQSGRARRG
jgi:hypothetical protein